MKKVLSGWLVLALGVGAVSAQTTMQRFREHFDKGKDYYKQGNYADAAAEFEAAHALNSAEPVTIKNLAQCYIQLKQLDKAEPLRKQLCDVDRNDEECLPLAEIQINLKKYEEALQTLDSIQNRGMPNGTAVEGRLRCYAHMALSQFDKAVPACRAGEPDQYEPIARQLMIACLKIADLECAKQFTTTFASKSAKDWVDIGKLWIGAADEATRKEFLNTYLDTAPDVASRRSIGLELARKALYDESTPILARVAAESQGDNCDIASALARGYLSARDHERTVEWSSKLIGCSPELAAGYAIRGSSYYVQKEWDKAIEDLTKAQSISPDPRVETNLANAQKYKASLEKAEKDAEAAKAAARRAQEEYERQIQKDKEQYCLDFPTAPECRKPPGK